MWNFCNFCWSIHNELWLEQMPAPPARTFYPDLKKDFSLSSTLSSLGGEQPSSDCKNSQRDGIRWEENKKIWATQGWGSLNLKKAFPQFLKPSPSLPALSNDRDYSSAFNKRFFQGLSTDKPRQPSWLGCKRTSNVFDRVDDINCFQEILYCCFLWRLFAERNRSW